MGMANVMTPSQVTFVVRMLLVASLFSNSSAQLRTIPPPTNTLQVFALPVGQGDCTIMQCPNGRIVVFDCGSSGGNRMTASQVESWLGSSINEVVAIFITHEDLDHYNYLYKIDWNTTNVQHVIIGGALENYSAKSKKTIRDWLNEWANTNKLYTIGNGVNSPPSDCIGNCVVGTGAGISTDFCSSTSINFNILSANVGTTANQRSIVLKLVANQWSMLLSGDMEGPASIAIANILKTGLKSLVYKISHHGASRLANWDDWLAPIKPTYAFASSGFNFRSCKHPHCETIKRIRFLNTVTMTTPHAFQCGIPSNTPTTYTNYRYNILETSPNSTHICLLTYISSTNVQPNVNCFPSTVQSGSTNDETIIDGECDDFAPNDREAVSSRSEL